MSSDCAIRLQALRKTYRLYRKPGDRVKQCMLPRLQWCLGRSPTNYYREHVALDDLSLEVRKGETLGVIGRNGSGKSTLLQLMSGILHPTSGTVEINGRVAALLDLGAGFHPEFTGRENVYVNAALFGLTKTEIDDRFDDIASFADIGAYIDQPVKTYSSGMFVRLAFAVIAHVHADILLIDEALAVGDAFFTQKCMRFLRGFMDRGTVVFVSHDSAAVLSLCRKALLLDRGRMLGLGEAKQVCDRYLQHLHESRDSQEIVTKPIQPSTKSSGDQAGLEPDVSCGVSGWDTWEGRDTFGDRKALIQRVSLHNARGRPVLSVTRQERLCLRIWCQTSVPLVNPVVGFLVRDRFGQTLFGQNTSLMSAETTRTVLSGTRFVAEFEFVMPLLRKGDYSVSVALAEGTQQHSIQHHWVHDAVVFESANPEHCFGFVAVEVMHARICWEVGRDCHNDTTSNSLAL